MSRAKKKLRPPVWHSWMAMTRACTGRAPAHARKLYSGISFFDEWQDYRRFERWAFANGWRKGLVLTRRDKAGDYCPANCFWASRAEANGWRSVVHRLPDGRTVRDVLGRESRGRDKRLHRRVTQRVFVEGWNLRAALEKPSRIHRRAE